MATFTQDYPALPGSGDAAAQHAHTVVAAHLPERARDARQVVAELFACALAKTGQAAIVNLITMVDAGRVRFEVHYPADQPEGRDPAHSHKIVASVADAYGEQPSRSGRMIYAELWPSEDLVTS